MLLLRVIRNKYITWKSYFDANKNKISNNRTDRQQSFVINEKSSNCKNERGGGGASQE